MTSSEAIPSSESGVSETTVEPTQQELQTQLEAEIDALIEQRRNPELDEFDLIRQARRERQEHSRSISNARAVGRTALEEKNSVARQVREQMETMRSPEFRSGVAAAQQRAEQIREKHRARSEWSQNHNSADLYPS